MKKWRLFVGRTKSKKSHGGSDVKKVFKALYEKYNSDLFNFLFYMVRNREQAEILAREVYIKVLNSYNQFDRKSNEEVYLFSMAHQVVADSIKKQNSTLEEENLRMLIAFLFLILFFHCSYRSVTDWLL